MASKNIGLSAAEVCSLFGCGDTKVRRLLPDIPDRYIFNRKTDRGRKIVCIHAAYIKKLIEIIEPDAKHLQMVLDWKEENYPVDDPAMDPDASANNQNDNTSVPDPEPAYQQQTGSVHYEIIDKVTPGEASDRIKELQLSTLNMSMETLLDLAKVAASTYQDQREQLSQNQEKLSEMRAIITRMEEQTKALEIDISKEKGSNEELRERVQAYEQTAEAEQNAVKEAEIKAAVAESEKNSLQTQFDALKKDKDALQQKIDEYESRGFWARLFGKRV